MLSDRTKVRVALQKYLKDNLSLSENIIFENVSIDPDPSKVYFGESFLTSASEQVTLLDSGDVRDIGLYQIDILAPTGRGTITTDTYIAELSTLFKNGTNISYSGIDVFIMKSYPSQGYTVDNWYMTPFTVEWECRLSLN